MSWKKRGLYLYDSKQRKKTKSEGREEAAANKGELHSIMTFGGRKQG